MKYSIFIVTMFFAVFFAKFGTFATGALLPNETILDPDTTPVPLEVCTAQNFTDCPFVPIKIAFEFSNDTTKLMTRHTSLLGHLLWNVIGFYEALLTVRRIEIASVGCNCDLYVEIRLKNCDAADTVLATATPIQLSQKNWRPLKGRLSVCVDSLPQTSSGFNLYWINTLKHEFMHILVFSSSLFSYYIDEQGNRRDPGSFMKTKTQIWSTSSGNYEHRATFLDLPRLNHEMRLFSGCDNHDGVELEGEGGLGTANVHFDKRIFGPEIMVGQNSGRAYFSQFSAALLEDSGWYLVNWNATHEDDVGSRVGNKRRTAAPLIERLENGWFDKQNAVNGCSFVKQGCRDYLKLQEANNRSIEPFCGPQQFVANASKPAEETGNIVKTDRCTPDYTAYARCNFANTAKSKSMHDSHVHKAGNELYESPRHFKNIAYSSDRESLMSGCPAKLAISVEQSGRKGDTYCLNEENYFTDASLNWNVEIFGRDSMCLNHDTSELRTSFLTIDCDLTAGLGLFNKPLYSPITGAGCYRYKCAGGRLHVMPFGDAESQVQRWLTCYGEGNRLQMSRLTLKSESRRIFTRGVLLCPKCSDICDECEPDETEIASIDLLQGCSGGYTFKQKNLLYFTVHMCVLSILE